RPWSSLARRPTGPGRFKGRSSCLPSPRTHSSRARGNMPTPAPPPAETASAPLSQELILALLLAAEILVFSFLGTNFLSRANAFEVVRLSAESGLLALALTPVIVAGGIDLSVGSLMGLSAVLFGMLWRDAGLPIWLAALMTLGVGFVAGGLNALLIT